MRRENIKVEIQRILDKVPDDMLEEVYSILKDFADKNSDTIKLSHNLNKILTEDKGLLDRLAK
jgi:predicted nucleic acid-binding protein